MTQLWREKHALSFLTKKKKKKKSSPEVDFYPAISAALSKETEKCAAERFGVSISNLSLFLGPKLNLRLKRRES